MQKRVLIYFICLFSCKDYFSHSSKLENTNSCLSFINTIEREVINSFPKVEVTENSFECASEYCVTKISKNSSLSFILTDIDEVNYLLSSNGLACFNIDQIRPKERIEVINIQYITEGEINENTYSLLSNGLFTFFVNYDPETIELNSSPNYVGYGRYKYLNSRELELCNFKTSKKNWKETFDHHYLLLNKCYIMKIPLINLKIKRIEKEKLLIKIESKSKKIPKKGEESEYIENFSRVIYEPKLQ